jgi:hypothetical protein
MPSTTIGTLLRPVKELKAFTKMKLVAGEDGIAKAILDKDSFIIYDASLVAGEA